MATARNMQSPFLYPNSQKISILFAVSKSSSKFALYKLFNT